MKDNGISRKKVMEIFRWRYDKDKLVNKQKPGLDFLDTAISESVRFFLNTLARDSEVYKYFNKRKTLGLSKPNLSKMITGDIEIGLELQELLWRYLFRTDYSVNTQPFFERCIEYYESGIAQEKTDDREGDRPELNPAVVQLINRLRAANLNGDLSGLHRAYERTAKSLLNENASYSLTKLNLEFIKVRYQIDSDFKEQRAVLENCLPVLIFYKVISDEQQALDLLVELCIHLKDLDAADMYARNYLGTIESSSLIDLANGFIKYGKVKLEEYNFEGSFLLLEKATNAITEAINNRHNSKPGAIDIVRGDISHQTAMIYKVMQMDSSIQTHLYQALLHYKAANDPIKTAIVQFEFARNEVYLGRVKNSSWQMWLDEAYPTFLLKGDTLHMSKCCALEFEAAFFLTDFPLALSKIKKANELAIGSNDSHHIYYVKLALARYYLSQEDRLDDAFSAFKSAYEYAQDCKMYQQSAEASFYLASMEIEPHRTNHLIHARDVLTMLYLEEKSIIRHADLMNDVAEISLVLDEPSEAAKLYKSIEEIYCAAKFKYGQAKAKLGILDIYMRQNDFHSALMCSSQLLAFIGGSDFYAIEATAKLYYAIASIEIEKYLSPAAYLHLKDAYEIGAKQLCAYDPRAENLYLRFRY